MADKVRDNTYFEHQISKHKMLWSFLETIAEINFEILKTLKRIEKKMEEK